MGCAYEYVCIGAGVSGSGPVRLQQGGGQHTQNAELGQQSQGKKVAARAGVLVCGYGVVKRHMEQPGPEHR